MSDGSASAVERGAPRERRLLAIVATPVHANVLMATGGSRGAGRGAVGHVRLVGALRLPTGNAGRLGGGPAQWCRVAPPPGPRVFGAPVRPGVGRPARAARGCATAAACRPRRPPWPPARGAAPRRALRLS